MENPLANRRPDEVRAAIEQAKSIAAEKNAPLTAERLAAALDMDAAELQAAVEGSWAGKTRRQREVLQLLQAAWREAMASVVEHALLRGSGASVHMQYLKSRLEPSAAADARPVYFVGEEELPP